MNAHAKTISFAGADLMLGGDGSLFWPEQHLMVVADLHIGRDEPAGSGRESTQDRMMLRKLTRTARENVARKILILGDFVHGKAALAPETIETLSEWRRTIDAELLLMHGSYDQLSTPLLNRWDIEPIGDKLVIAPLLFCPKPSSPRSTPQVCGHLHPCVRLTRAAESPALPCFVVEQNLILMPSFGDHRDGYEILEKENRTFYVLCDGEVRLI